jgi:transposase
MVAIAASSPVTGAAAGLGRHHAQTLVFRSTEGCTNRPTEAVNLLRKAKRIRCGLRSLANYRRRLLLHCRVTWQGGVSFAVTAF